MGPIMSGGIGGAKIFQRILRNSFLLHEYKPPLVHFKYSWNSLLQFNFYHFIHKQYFARGVKSDGLGWWWRSCNWSTASNPMPRKASSPKLGASSCKNVIFWRVSIGTYSIKTGKSSLQKPTKLTYVSWTILLSRRQ